jgi:hypothetical protein
MFGAILSLMAGLAVVVVLKRAAPAINDHRRFARTIAAIWVSTTVLPALAFPGVFALVVRPPYAGLVFELVLALGAWFASQAFCRWYWKQVLPPLGS